MCPNFGTFVQFATIIPLNHWTNKREPEPRNGNGNIVYFIDQARGNILEPVTRSLFTMNEHAIANVFELPT